LLRATLAVYSRAVHSRVTLAVILGLGLLARPADAIRPALRGVIEGYYGRPWSGPDRRDVIRFLGAHALNTFLYAPKNDDYHRTRWRDPYPDAALADLKATAVVARRARVRFVFGLSPVLDVCYSCPADLDALTAKLAQVARAGIRHFALLFDDAPPDGALVAPEDQARYGGTDAVALARAEGDLVSRVRRRLRSRHLGHLDLMVPSAYAGTACTPDLAALAKGLARGVPVAWTGPGVFAAEITAAMARARAACVPGHPVVLWDNYPVNDTVVSNNLHLGPLTGRDAALPGVLAGYLLNPMTQPHASLVALGTAAAYLRAPRRYDPEAAWHVTLHELDGGGTGFDTLAAQVRSSALDLDDARELAAALTAVESTYADDDWTDAVDDLAAEEGRQAAAPADIAARLGSTPLGTEIGPWVAELAAHAARGTDAVALLRALKPSFADVVLTQLAGGGAHVTGRALPPDHAVADLLGPGFSTEATAVAARVANPPVGDYLSCLGLSLLQTADIHFCPQFGLNVHGKSLFFLIRSASDVSIVSDENVHDRLVRFTGAAYDAFSTGRTPDSDALTMTVEGVPASLGADGSFDATVPVAILHVRLRLTTAAGELTLLDLGESM